MILEQVAGGGDKNFSYLAGEESNGKRNHW